MSRRKRARGTRQQASKIDRAPPPGKPRHRAALVAAICAILVVVSFVAFWSVISNAFVTYDDDVYVTGNARVQQGITLDNAKWAFTTTYFGFYYPVTWLSHMLDCQLYGLDAGKHHLTSLGIHALNAVLLFILLLRMTGALWRSALVAGLFALHPLHVESVAWIAERKDVLSTLFWMLAVLAWVRYVKTKSWHRYVFVLVLFAVGLMAKSMLVTLPFLLLLLDYWPLGRLTLERGRRSALGGLLLEKAPLFAMSAVSCVVTLVAQRSAGAVQPLEDFPITERFANAALTYVSYLAKTVWPASLAVFYPHPHVGLFAWRVCGSVLLLAGITAFALMAAKKVPYVAVGWLWYLGALVPVIGLVQVGVQASADRYTYVPLVGIFIVIAWGLSDLCVGSRAVRHALAVLACACLVVFLFVTRTQVKCWKDSTALFEHALAVTSDNYLAHYNLGLLLQNEGRRDEAISHYEKAVRIKPDYYKAHDNLGNVLADAGNNDAAIEQYEDALRISPSSANVLNNLGVLLTKLNRLPEAIESLQRAVEIRPDFAVAHNNLGVAFGKDNRVPEAIEHFQRATKINPDYAWAHANLGLSLAREKHYSEAREHFQEALRIDPSLNLARDNLEKIERIMENQPGRETP